MEMPRWTIAELITRYELEPSLTDVFVEGQYDKDILVCAYAHSSVESRSIYTADVIEINEELFEKHNLTSGSKQKLIVLCRELAVVNSSENVRFIVDRDTDHWLGDLEIARGLVWTDFCDIESYFFEEVFVRDLIENAGKAKIGDWHTFYASFCETLKILFAIRIVDRNLKLYLSYITFDRFLSVDGGIVHFDFETYVDRVLNKSRLSGRKQDFLDGYNEWIGKLQGEPRLFCRGHDFILLIAWSILKFKGVKNFSDEVVARILVVLVPRDTKKFASLL
ncbi:DUF4435 domain-containing protein [Pannonibacter phragmitetus]|uniref:DUF4435 domain-containing protein n=1 Tax=Pannonibacter phragmitetus TaxID=121719 RepID=UPI000E670AFC|nr:DUF4435 domain-containing protein [Pannonibacter phragmitetus]